MSAYGETEVDVEAEIERRANERVAAKLAEQGITERASEEQISAEIDAAKTPDELHAVLGKHGMLREHD